MGDEENDIHDDGGQDALQNADDEDAAPGLFELGPHELAADGEGNEAEGGRGDEAELRDLRPGGEAETAPGPL